MGVVGRVVKVLAFAYALVVCAELYKNFAPHHCTDDHSPCVKPLFRPETLVDVYVYVSQKRKLKDQKAFDDPALQLIHNASNIAIEEGFKAVVKIPQTYSLLVRQNQTLHAHVVIVPAGLSPNPAHHQKVKGKAPDVLYTSARLTRYLPRRSERYENLIRAKTSEGEEGNRAGSFNGYTVSLPYDLSVAVDAQSVFNMLAVGFVGTSLLEPTLASASVRMALAGTLPIVYRKAHAETEQAPETLKRALREVNAKVESVVHLRPSLPIRVTADDAEYRQLPVLYSKMTGGKLKGPKTVTYEFLRHPKIGDWVYLPKMYIEDAFTLRRHWREVDLNTSREELQVSVELTSVGRYQFSMQKTFLEGLKVYEQMGIGEHEMDEVKWMLIRRPLHIIIAMQVISMIQVFLSAMAFKNDISFFQGRSDYAGLSSRSLATDALQSWIIFFYLFDYKDASQIILFQLLIGALIDTWKLKKRTHATVQWKYLLPWVVWRKRELSEGERKTEDIDAKGMYYLKLCLYPLSVAWGLYCVYYYRYKSWWSWLISSLADFAYTFGFVNMCPQIFINYKLKSVAHMPWRVLIYKAFNTFIDDVFAWWIMAERTTKKHRLMTLRDDLVFLVFLYQRYLYPVDASRPDEFGYVYLDTQNLANAATTIQRFVRTRKGRNMRSSEKMKEAVQPALSDDS